MASLNIVGTDGSAKGTLDVSDAVFGAESNEGLVHQVVVALQSNARQGTHKTKERSEIRGGGRKPFRQKGTGNARQGTIRAAQMRGGGTVFGPKPRKYKHDIPVQVRRKALSIVLSERLRADRLSVLQGLAIETPKTQPFAQMVAALAPEGRKTLIVTPEHDNNVLLSARNLQRVTIRTAAEVNALDVLNAQRIVLQEEAVRQLEERLS